MVAPMGPEGAVWWKENGHKKSHGTVPLISAVHLCTYFYFSQYRYFCSHICHVGTAWYRYLLTDKGHAFSYALWSFTVLIFSDILPSIMQISGFLFTPAHLKTPPLHSISQHNWKLHCSTLHSISRHNWKLLCSTLHSTSQHTWKLLCYNLHSTSELNWKLLCSTLQPISEHT